MSSLSRRFPVIGYLFPIAVLVLSLCGVEECHGGVVQLRGAVCGTLTCNAEEYCNQYSGTCESCASICDPDHHNFDEPKCKKQCEVYIYDQRYLRSSGSGNDDGNLRGAVQQLQAKYVVILTLLIIVILVQIVICSIFVWKWKTDNNVTWATIHHKISGKRSDNTNGVSANKTAVNNDPSGKKAELRLEIGSNSVQSEPTPVTMTTGITTRIPAEDSIDYAYDNPAMSSSPKKTGSTTS